MKGTKSRKKGKAKITKSKLSSRKQKQRQKPSKRGTTHQVSRRKTGGAEQSIGIKKTLLKRKKPSRKSGVVAVKPAAKNNIVRIMGQGQFSVDNKILEKLNEIDSMLVQLVNTDRPDDNEFKKHLIELTRIVQKNGKQLDSKQIIQSDIILPSADLSIDEAKRLF